MTSKHKTKQKIDGYILKDEVDFPTGIRSPGFLLRLSKYMEQRERENQIVEVVN